MKNTQVFLKIVMIVTFFFLLGIIFGIVGLVFQKLITLKELFFYTGASSIFLVIFFTILGVINCQNDQDEMLNREIEFRAVLDKLNEDVYFKKNVMWTVGPLGSFLKAKNVEFGL